MLFSLKIFLCTVVAVALSFATGGYLLISSNFTAARDREISLAKDEHLSLQYMLESAFITQQLQGQGMSNDMVRNAAQAITSSLQQDGQGGRNILVYDNKGSELYPQPGKKAQFIKELTSLHPGQVVYAVKQSRKTYTLSVTGAFTYSSEKMYLSYSQDISEVFLQRDAQFHTFMLYQGVNILMSAALAFFISWLPLCGISSAPSTPNPVEHQPTMDMGTQQITPCKAF